MYIETIYQNITEDALGLGGQPTLMRNFWQPSFASSAPVHGHRRPKESGGQPGCSSTGLTCRKTSEQGSCRYTGTGFGCLHSTMATRRSVVKPYSNCK